ncbi:rhodanese-like domain-containing protein [Nocardioides maradonensis]
MSALPVDPRPLARYDGIDAMLASARAGLDRLSPRAAFQEVITDGAVLVDIRPAAQRAAKGEVAPWLEPRVVERNVLEWRFDPRSDARVPEAAYDLRVIVLCQEGYTSSLAAHALREIGVLRATDVVGGFAAWRHAGMPILGPAPV